MVLTDVLSVIIGIIFIWMLLGVAVMQIQEWIVGWLGLRADTLEDAIRGMLLNPKQRRGPWGRLWEQLKERRGIRRLPGVTHEMPPVLVQAFYHHPLIRSMAQARAKPSYISADTFAQALLDTVAIAGLDGPALGRALSELQSQWPDGAGHEADEALQALVLLATAAAQAPERIGELHRELEAFRATLARVEAGQGNVQFDLPDALEAVLRAQLPPDGERMVALVEQGAAALLATSPLLRQRLDILIRQAMAEVSTAESQLASLRGQVAGWFDETMDHVTGWYKRNRQWGAFAIGLVIAGLLNVDTLGVASALWRQPALREALTAAAAQEIEAQLPDAGAADPQAAAAQIEETLSSLKVPIGWQEAPEGWDILAKVAGIVITAAMAMQGAPFWFDILDKLVPIRAAGVRPARAAPTAPGETVSPPPTP